MASRFTRGSFVLVAPRTHDPPMHSRSPEPASPKGAVGEEKEKPQPHPLEREGMERERPVSLRDLARALWRIAEGGCEDGDYGDGVCACWPCYAAWVLDGGDVEASPVPVQKFVPVSQEAPLAGPASLNFGASDGERLSVATDISPPGDQERAHDVEVALADIDYVRRWLVQGAHPMNLARLLRRAYDTVAALSASQGENCEPTDKGADKDGLSVQGAPGEGLTPEEMG